MSGEDEGAAEDMYVNESTMNKCRWVKLVRKRWPNTFI